MRVKERAEAQNLYNHQITSERKAEQLFFLTKAAAVTIFERKNANQ